VSYVLFLFPGFLLFFSTSTAFWRCFSVSPPPPAAAAAAAAVSISHQLTHSSRTAGS
jgi:hypothetical protein